MASTSASTIQQQNAKKQILLNNYIDKLLEISNTLPTNNSTFQKKLISNEVNKSQSYVSQINLSQLFDLLIWAEKRKPQILQHTLEMNVLLICFNCITIEQMLHEVKAFILLINNCKVNGRTIIYLLSNYLIDKIIMKYLSSLAKSQKQNKKESDMEQALQYLGSLLKACHSHLNEKTYPYFLNRKKDIDIQNEQQNQQQLPNKKEIPKFKDTISQKTTSSLFDPEDIFNTCDISLQFHHQQQQEKQCLLVKVCTRFYNCPEEITKTSVLNILLSILRQPFCRQLFYSKLDRKPFEYVYSWSANMCRQFRNELKNFNQQLMILKKQQIDFYTQQITDKIIFWQDLTNNELKEIFKENFMNHIVLSLIIGSLNTNALPMFNIKFTFYILAKMMRICLNLNMLQRLGSLLFKQSKIKYFDSWVCTAVLKGFDFEHILDDQHYDMDQSQYEIKNSFTGTHEYFFNMLKSKDEHFLQISSNMLHQLLLYVRKDQKALTFFNETLQFGPCGKNFLSILTVLMNQLRFDHSLNILKRICQTIIFINPSKMLNQQSTNEFIYFYSQYLNQTMELIEKQPKHWQYIIQCFQYDTRILQMMKFATKAIKDKFLLFHPTQRLESIKETKQVQKQQNNGKQIDKENMISFYNMIPETPNQVLRYRIVKTFLLLKFRETVIGKQGFGDTLTRYVQKLNAWQQKQIKPGELLTYPIKQRFYHCKVIEHKTQIPCIVIQDDVNFIVGFVESNHVKVIINTKIKHIDYEILTKKDKTFIKLSISKFDYGTQNIVYKSTILMRGFQTGIQYLSVKKQNFKQKQLMSIKKGLKKAREDLPQICLL